MLKTRNAKFPLEKKAEQVLEELRISVRKIVYWLTKPSKNMADVFEKLAFIFLLISIILRARGW